MTLEKTITLVIICWCCSTAVLNAQQNLLFTDFNGTLTPTQRDIIANNLAVTTIKQNKAVIIDQHIFEQTAIDIPLFDNRTISFTESDLDVSGINFKHWTGELLNGNGTGAFLINGDRISGHFSGEFGNFEIYPLGNGIHIFAELDDEQFASCGNESEDNASPNSSIKDAIQQKERDIREKSAIGTECFIRLIVPYTPDAKTNTFSDYGRTMNEHIGLAVMESNQGYANSDVELRVELAYSYASTDSETFLSGTDVNALQSKTDGKWDEVHGFRDDYDGDMVCLVTGGYFLVCGQAFGFDYTDESNMFQVSSYSCIVGNYTFAHEFGHNQGCRHDNDNTGDPFSYARGYNDGTERTIMAVSSSTEPRRNHWSNPDIDFSGGGSTGTIDRDNARALDEGDAIVASHRVTPNIASIDEVVLDDHTLSMVAVNTLTSTSEVEAGAILELKSQGMILLEEGFHARSGAEFRASAIPACTASYAIRDESIDARTTAIEQFRNAATIAVNPNPFSSNTQIIWQQEVEGTANLQIQNAYGQVVENIAQNQWFTAGQHTIDLDASDLTSGLYYLVLDTNQKRVSKAIMVLTR